MSLDQVPACDMYGHIHGRLASRVYTNACVCSPGLTCMSTHVMSLVGVRFVTCITPYMAAWLQKHLSTHVYTHVYTCMRIRTCVYAHASTCTYTRTYTYKTLFLGCLYKHKRGLSAGHSCGSSCCTSYRVVTHPT